MCLTFHAQYSTAVRFRQSYFLTLARKRKLLRNFRSSLYYFFFLPPKMLPLPSGTASFMALA